MLEKTESVYHEGKNAKTTSSRMNKAYQLESMKYSKWGEWILNNFANYCNFWSLILIPIHQGNYIQLVGRKPKCEHQLRQTVVFENSQPSL